MDFSSQGADQLFHFVCGILRHSVADVAISIKSESDGRVSQRQGQRLEIDLALDRQRGVGMPLWYIKDKPGKP